MTDNDQPLSDAVQLTPHQHLVAFLDELGSKLDETNTQIKKATEDLQTQRTRLEHAGVAYRAQQALFNAINGKTAELFPTQPQTPTL